MLLQTNSMTHPTQEPHVRRHCASSLCVTTAGGHPSYRAPVFAAAATLAQPRRLTGRVCGTPCQRGGRSHAPSARTTGAQPATCARPAATRGPPGTPRLQQSSHLRMCGRCLRCFHQPPQSPGSNAAAQSAGSRHDCASASCMRETRAARMRREAQATTGARVKARSAAARAVSALADAPSGRRRTGAPGPAAAAA